MSVAIEKNATSGFSATSSSQLRKSTRSKIIRELAPNFTGQCTGTLAHGLEMAIDKTSYGHQLETTEAVQ